jgi:tetratricopeptide (TPR) repeat protein/predicted Ser/Thr protein kinase
MASRVGQAFGRFRILERIGAGGMGEVYRARDEHLARDVAIKFLAPGAAQADSRRMEREAHALSTLNHPNIATIHDFVHDEAGDFVVMEFIAGESLSARLKDGPLDVATVLDLARQIASGLDEAHQRGIVHRDLKPGNVMVTPKGQAKIVDFGIAEPARDETNAATATNVLDTKTMGTLAYMAPEQIRGAPVDPRTDVWSFGAVLYELLTGRPPFVENNSLLLADAVLNRVPATPTSQNSAVPAAFDGVILRALNKLPAERFATAGELVAALGVPAGTGPVALPGIRPAGARARSRPRLQLAAAVLGIIGIAAVAAWWIITNRPVATPASKLAVLVADAVNRTGDASLDGVVNELLSTSLEQSKAISVFPRSRLAYVLGELMRRDPATPIDETVGREICARVGLNALVTSSVSRLGDAYVLVVTMTDANGRLIESARESFQKPSELPAKMDASVLTLRQRLGESAASIQTSVPLADVASSSLEAVRFYTQARQRQYAGDPVGAIALYKQAIALDPQFAMAYEYLGVAYTNLQDPTHAEEYLLQAVKLADRVPEAERHKILADYNMLMRNYAVACPHFEVLAELRPLDPTSFLSLGYCKSFTFDYDGAIADTERGLKMQPSQRARVNLAWLKFLSGDAGAALTGANAIRQEVRNNLQAHFVAAQAELALGQIDAAQRTYQTMVSLGGPAEMQGLMGLADIALGTGNWKEAANRLTAARDSADRQQNALASGRVRTALADLALAEGRSGEVAGLMAGLGEQSDLVLVYLAGRTYARAGRLADADRALGAMKLKADAAPADQALAAMLRSEIARARRDTAAAVSEADAAWGLERSVLARETQALAYAAAGRQSDAATAYTDVLRRRTERIAAYDAQSFHRVVQDEYLLGVLLDEMGLREGARPLLEKIVTVWTGGSGALAADARRRLAKSR